MISSCIHAVNGLTTSQNGFASFARMSEQSGPPHNGFTAALHYLLLQVRSLQKALDPAVLVSDFYYMQGVNGSSCFCEQRSALLCSRRG